MQTKEYARTEGITGSRGSADIFLGQIQGRLPGIFTPAGSGESPLGKMNDDQFADTFLKKRSGGMSQGDGIELAIRLSNLEAGRFPRLDFI